MTSDMEALQPMEKEYLTCAETAKFVRAALKKEFPSAKFSVISNSYSGGASIRVSWLDGPTEEQVKEITNQYDSRYFDCLTP